MVEFHANASMGYNGRRFDFTFLTDQKVVQVKKALMGLLLGDGTCKTQFLRQFKFVMVVEYMTDDNTRGKQNLEIVMKTEDDQKHMNTILRKRHYTAQSFFVFPEPSLATFQKNMTSLENKMNNIGEMSDVELDWALNLTNYFERVMGDIWNKANVEKMRRHTELAETIGEEQEESEEEEQEESVEEEQEKSEKSNDSDDEGVFAIFFINEPSNDDEHYLFVKVPQEIGDDKVGKFYFTGQTTGDDLYNAMEKYFGEMASNVIMKWCGTASVIERHDRLASYFKCGDMVRCEILFAGGGKRAKVPKDAEDIQKSPKDLKQKVLGNVIQLKALQPVPALTQDVITQIEQIMASAVENPDKVASAMIDRVPKETLGIIIANLHTSSPRPEGKIDFILSHVMPRMIESTDELVAHANLAKQTLALALQYAVHLEFEDAGRGIGWQNLVKVMTSKATSTSTVVANPDGRNCSVM